MKQFSQNDEDIYILNFFRDHPNARFLDIGAYDGKTFSNTHGLALKGWEGTLVEPSPRCFASLMKTYRGNEKVNLVNLAVGGTGGRIVKFHDSEGATATANEENFARWKDHQQDYQTIHVARIPVAALLANFPGPYPFVSIDTEGSDWDILQNLDLKALETRMICIEHGEHKGPIVEYLAARGFKVVYENGENTLASL